MSAIHAIALQALRTRTLVRLQFDGGEASRIRTELSGTERADAPSDAAARLVDAFWDEQGGGRYDGALLGVARAAVSPETATLACRTMRYRDYVATDRLLEADPQVPVPLAVGVHALLLTDAGTICLRLEDERLALPGGAVDAADLRDASGNAIAHAAAREIAEETGINISGRPIEVTGLYVGGYPTHLIALLAIDLGGSEAGRAIGDFSPADPLDGVRSVELTPLAELMGRLDGLPLAFRAALRSLRHRRGEDMAWTISA